MRGIFINYRGADSGTAAALIDRELTARFGRRLVFLDCMSLPVGCDFAGELLARLRTSSVLLVVIGPRWLSLAGADGRRLIDDQSDWVRREIVGAFAAGLRVIPVLTDDARLPAEVELPADIAALSRRQYVTLRRRYPAVDLDNLASKIVEAEPHFGRLGKRSREADVLPRQLPPVVRDFVGRTAAIGELDLLLPCKRDRGTGAAKIAVLDGPAGVGKTTSAVWWAHRVQHAHFPGGTLFVDLHGYGPAMPLRPAAVLVSFLHALGVPDDRVPEGLDAQVGMYRSLLEGRRVLILLDNAADADQVRPLLPSSAECLVLVTSRSRLGGLVVGETAHRITLDRFDRGEAEGLVRGVVGADRAAAEPGAIRQLVELCAYLPLALRVAAARIAANRHTGIADVVEDLTHDQDRLDALSNTGDERTAVRTVFEWSYARLPGEQARMFRCLGLHPGPEISVSAAAALTATDASTAYRHLEALADVHLVESVGRRRYRVHDLLRAYAAYRADTDDTPKDRRDALTLMVTWYGQSAAAADRLVFPAQPSLTIELGPPVGEAPFGDRTRAWAWLTMEQATLFASLHYAADQHMHHLTVALSAVMRFLALRPRAWWHQRLQAESLGITAARALEDRIAEATLLRRRADTYQMLGHWAESDTDLERNIALALQADDPVLHGEALCGIGRNRKLQRRHAEALTYYQMALPLVRGTRTGYVEAVVESNLSQITAYLGRYHDAVHHAERELTLRRQCSDRLGEGYALHNLATARQGLGDHNAAIALGERAIAIYRSTVGTERYLADALATVADSAERTGSRARAVSYLAEATVILAERDDPHADVLRRRVHDMGVEAEDTLEQ